MTLIVHIVMITIVIIQTPGLPGHRAALCLQRGLHEAWWNPSGTRRHELALGFWS